jgi:endogenous inhibitor of DNA gyrase (YacG/DUF329 family)
MALIKCPECGKEVSDKASACINCGFPLSELADTNIVEETLSKAVVYYDLLEGKRKSVFDNGLDDGVEGMCNEGDAAFPYQVKGNCLYITRYAGTVEYIIGEDFLANQNGKYDGNIPDESRFDVVCTSSLFGTTTFKSDGTYSKISFGSTDKGTYIREGNIMALSGSNTGYKPNGFLIYDGNFYMGSNIKEEKIDVLKSVISKYGAPQTPINTVSFSRPTTPIVKCPYCQSGNTKKISSTAKAVNIAMFGLFGNKRKYQWHCNNCNSDF